ncbi:MAG: hypothetical protein WAL32_03095 [Terriglobales bacterium]
MACPFFVPTRKLDDAGWLHPARLPLGGGWQGHCSAPGHEGAEPSDQYLHESCNLGYAAKCAWLPKERACDAVRFSIAHDRGDRLLLWFICESDHRPAAHGMLEFDLMLARWTTPHADARIQKMAECFLESYLLRRIHSVPADTASRANS